jgi:sugar lactone lactonase YvrE
MRKLISLILIITGIAYISGCGTGTSSGTATTVFGLPAAFSSNPIGATLLGGSIQGTPLVLASPVSNSILSGSIASTPPVTGTGTAAMYNKPIAVTTNGSYIFVADYLNNVIRRLDKTTGTDTILAGSPSGSAGSTDSTATSIAATFYRPSGITTDGVNLYVTDSYNYTVRKIVIATGYTTVLAGTAGQSGHVDAAGTAARFNILNGITLNGNYLYVTDSDNTIRMIDITNGAVTTLAGSPGNSGSSDGKKDTARFDAPARLTTDGPNLYVTDFNNSTIRKIALSDATVSTIAGVVSPGGSAGTHADSTVTDNTGRSARFNQPNGITCDGTNLFVTDSYDNKVRKIVIVSTDPLFSGPVTTLAAIGSSALNVIVGITTDGTSLYLTDVSVDNSSHVIRSLSALQTLP